MPVDAPPVYPAAPPNGTALTPGTFFSPVPTDQILALAGARRLKRPDAMLLLALLAHKRRPDVTEVRPGQDRLAALLTCSVRTVQRGLARLEAAGLLVKRYVRDRRGHLHGLRYDLAKTLALLPPPARRPRADATHVSPAPTRHGRRPESESDAVEIDNTAPPLVVASPLVVSPIVESLVGAGVLRRVALRLAAQHGDARCRQALDAVAQRRRIASVPAWLCRCLSEGWDLAPAPQSAAATRPQSQHPYALPAAPEPRALADGDGLALLPPARRDALERAARAQLSAELPALRASLSGGRSRNAVQARMRLLLAAARLPGVGGLSAPVDPAALTGDGRGSDL